MNPQHNSQFSDSKPYLCAKLRFNIIAHYLDCVTHK